MSICFIDCETIGGDLKVQGAHRYAENWPTVFLLCWAIDNGPVRTWHSASGDPFPIIEADTYVAHNAGFDRVVLSLPHYGYPADPARWECTLAGSAAYGLGALTSLEDACRIMQLPYRKDKAGKELLLAALKRGSVEPAELPRLAAYCASDVVACRALYHAIPRLTDFEQQVWVATERTNDRGVPIDLGFVEAALRMVEGRKPSLIDDMSAATGGHVVKVGSPKLLPWLSSHGVTVPNLRAETLTELLEYDDVPPRCREAIEVRLAGCKSSTGRLSHVLDRTCSDGRLRGSMLYLGAAATGRWSSRGVQLHNLTRARQDAHDVAAAVASDASADAIKARFGEPVTAIAKSIRMIIRGQFTRADFSQVEARVLSWLSGNETMLQAFRDYDAGVGPDVYRIAAADVYNIPQEAVTPDQRQLGKTLVLALGYGGGLNAMVNGAKKYGARLEEGTEFDIIRSWQQSRPDLSGPNGLWKSLVVSAHEVAADCGSRSVSRVFMEMDGTAMAVTLPSGRKLWYPHITTGLTDFGEPVAISQGRIMDRRLLTNNVTQAVARDLMASAWVKAEEQGLNPILAIHDELILECQDVAGLERVMRDIPPWAEGIPVTADAKLVDHV